MQASRCTHLCSVRIVWVFIQAVIINNLNVIITVIIITSLIAIYYCLNVCFTRYFILWVALSDVCGSSLRFISVVIYGLLL